MAEYPKLVAVCDLKSSVVQLLKVLLKDSGLACRVVPAASLQKAELLLLSAPVQRPPAAAVCVLPLELPRPPLAEKTVTYSTGNGEADFTARSLGGTLLELSGLGVITRVRLSGALPAALEAVLAASAAAVCCGVPFARVAKTIQRGFFAPGAAV